MRRRAVYYLHRHVAPETSLRPQPSSRDAVEARYTDIDSLDFTMEPSLSEGIAELLNRGAGERIESAREFVNGLQRAATELGWQFPDYYTSSASSDARVQMRKGLAKLREGHESIRDARDLFREALIQDGISREMEAELRRLVVALNEMLNHRVVP